MSYREDMTCQMQKMSCLGLMPEASNIYRNRFIQNLRPLRGRASGGVPFSINMSSLRDYLELFYNIVKPYFYTSNLSINRICPQPQPYLIADNKLIRLNFRVFTLLLRFKELIRFLYN